MQSYFQLQQQLVLQISSQFNKQVVSAKNIDELAQPAKDMVHKIVELILP